MREKEKAGKRGKKSMGKERWEEKCCEEEAREEKRGGAAYIILAMPGSCFACHRMIQPRLKNSRMSHLLPAAL